MYHFSYGDPRYYYARYCQVLLMDREQQFIRNRILSQRIAIQLVLRKRKKEEEKRTKRRKNARKSA